MVRQHSSSQATGLAWEMSGSMLMASLQTVHSLSACARGQTSTSCLSAPTLQRPIRMRWSSSLHALVAAHGGLRPHPKQPHSRGTDSTTYCAVGRLAMVQLTIVTTDKNIAEKKKK